MTSSEIQDRWAHQVEAVAAMEEALARGGRATLEMACGTGKSVVAARSAGRLAAHGRVLVAVPTLELIVQMLREFRDHGLVDLGEVVGVCSSDEIRHMPRGMGGMTSFAQVTTAAADLATWTAVKGRVTVLTTYHSMPVVAAAHADHAMPPWDLVIADEAHRTAGLVGGAWTQIHDDVAIPADRRLYMTATRKIFEEKGDVPAFSMDDEKVYGRVAYRLPFSTAFERGLIADYEIVAAAVTDEHIKSLTDNPDVRLQLARTAVSAQVLATQVTVLRAAADYGIRRAITFHNRVADAQGWAQTVRQAWEIMDAGQRPRSVSAYVVHGAQDPTVRRSILKRLSKDPDHPDELRIVCNSRVLTEGVDAPAVDSVVMVDRRTSVIDVVQSVGRALRLDHPGKIARIIVPVLLEPGEDAESAIAGSAFGEVWQVLRAMRALDDRLAGQLDAGRLRLGSTHLPETQADDSTSESTIVIPGSDNRIPKWLSLSGIPVPKGFAEAISLHAVKSAASSWYEFYGAAKQYFEINGDLGLPISYEAPSGLRLGQWLGYQRRIRNTLPEERVHLLDSIGMLWTKKDLARQQSWKNGLAAARAFAAANEGFLHDVPRDFLHEGFKLDPWLVRQRRHYNEGTLPAELKTALDAIDPTWLSGNSLWDAYYRDALLYFQKNGNLRVDDTYRSNNRLDLPGWLKRQRRYRRSLSARRQKCLNEIGMIWSVPEDEWDLGLSAARAYAAEHGTLDVGSGWVTADNFPLGNWLRSCRSRADRLSGEQRQALEALDHDWASQRYSQVSWDKYYNAAAVYAERHGRLPAQGRKHLPPPEGLDFRDWLVEQRQLARHGVLSAERHARLDALDPHWRPKLTEQQKWEMNFQAAAAYAQKHGALPFGRGAPVPDGHDFRDWLNLQRERARGGSLLKARRYALAELDFNWLDGPPKAVARDAISNVASASTTSRRGATARPVPMPMFASDDEALIQADDGRMDSTHLLEPSERRD
ncbi:Helicase associated domain protein [Sphaerisporangium sp. NPDC051017]|uniref:DEAD/DEAH box helicase n=1 Tax=Sphaerisporangium sp. NPDC051017 TaxID=3154636 RepID=UPI003433A063